MGAAPTDQRALVVGKNAVSGYCQGCKDKGVVYTVPFPTSARLLINEMTTVHMRTEFKLDINTEVNPRAVAAPCISGRAALLDPHVFLPTVQKRVRFQGGEQPGVDTLPEGFLHDGQESVEWGEAHASHKRRRTGEEFGEDEHFEPVTELPEGFM